MTELLTAAQMRAIEKAAIESGEVTGLELMERAGQGVVEAVLDEWPEMAKTSQRAVVLCGPGNNGGDGFVVARLLKDRGWEVEVFLYGDPEKLPPDAKANYQRVSNMTKVRHFDSEEIGSTFADVYVDAIFGSGLRRSLDKVVEDVIQEVAWSNRWVAIDAPASLCLDSGRLLNSSLSTCSAALTVTFHRPRQGHHLSDGPLISGKVVEVDLGLANLDDESLTRLVQGRIWVSMQIAKPDADHKYAHGHALILAGGPGKGGAARLAARGALRIGAGLVTLACPQNALRENTAQLNAIMVEGLDGVAGLCEMLEDKRLNAMCLGPGLGRGADTQKLVLEALAAERATVLDADALTRFERNPGTLFEALHERCVLTPHGGEFAKLFPDIAEKLAAPATKGPAYSKVDASREAAARAGCVVLFKGPDTVIASPNGRCSINSAHYERSAPWLATAGSGDVLAGFITGLMARGFGPMQAAETAAWLHVECALSFGPGLIAEDIPEELPKVFRALGV